MSRIGGLGGFIDAPLSVFTIGPKRHKSAAGRIVNVFYDNTDSNNNSNNSIGQLIPDVRRNSLFAVETKKKDGQAWEESWGGVSCKLACRRFHAACHAARKVPRRSVTLHSSHLRRACPCHAPGCRSQMVFPFPPSVPATRVHMAPLSSSHLDSAA